MIPRDIGTSDPAHVRAVVGTWDSGPVQPNERNQLIDVLRGFALLGILQINWEQTSGTLSDLIQLVAKHKFYTIYAFLFGLGFAIQIIRAEEAKRPFIVRYLWRTLILFLVGATHFIFIWNGDIVRIYALVAPVLLFARSWRPSLVLALAAATLVFSMSPQVPEGHLWMRVNPERAEAERVETRLREATGQANPPGWCHVIPGLTVAYRRDVCRNAGEVRTLLTRQLATVQWWKSPDGYLGFLSMFLLGLYAGRRRILRDPARHTRLLAWVVGVAFVVGLVGNALFLFPDVLADQGFALPVVLHGWAVAYVLSSIGPALFYVSGVTLCFTHWPCAQRLLTPLANVGRMGLTNYLMQSVLFVMVLGSRGFGLGGHFHGWSSLLLINSFFVLQILLSNWWFRHDLFGPSEWFGRSLTWFRVQPMRLRHVPPAA